LTLPRLILRLALVFSLATAGCQITPTFTTGYELTSTPMRSAPVDGRLAVLPFEEARSERYYSSSGRLFLTYIPLVPYVSMPFERLDESIKIQSDAIARSGSGITAGARQNVAPAFESYYYPNSFSEAVANDLRASGLFESVDFLGPGSTASDANNHRYVLTGTLHASELRNTSTSFGLGMAGVLLWLLPVPMSKATGEVDLDLVLTDQQTGRIVWQKRVKDSVQRYYSLYTSSAMIYGRGGAFSLNIYRTPADSGVDRDSLFSWQFAALRKSMLDAQEEIASALAAVGTDRD